MISHYANIRFVEVEDAQQANIVFIKDKGSKDETKGDRDDYLKLGNKDGVAFATAYGENKGAVFKEKMLDSLGGHARGIIRHEVLHALGLHHPHEKGVPVLYDSDNISALSYTRSNNESLHGYLADLSANTRVPETILPLDVEGLQSLYGPNPNTGKGNDVYSIDLPDGQTPKVGIRTIYDSGGIDTLVTSDHIPSSRKELDLREGIFHRSKGWVTGVFISSGSNIENAQGSKTGDRLTGNKLDNELYGGGGDDVFTGGEGKDTFVIGQNVSRKASGYSVITDFNRHEDVIRLARDVSPEKMRIEQVGAHTILLFYNDKGTPQQTVLLQNVSLDSPSQFTLQDASGKTVTPLLDDLLPLPRYDWFQETITRATDSEMIRLSGAREPLLEEEADYMQSSGHNTALEYAAPMLSVILGRKITPDTLKKMNFQELRDLSKTLTQQNPHQITQPDQMSPSATPTQVQATDKQSHNL